MVAHARMPLPIELFKKPFLLRGSGKLCSKFGEDQCVKDVAILSTDAGRTDGRTVGRWREFMFCPMQWTDSKASGRRCMSVFPWRCLSVRTVYEQVQRTFHQYVSVHQISHADGG